MRHVQNHHSNNSTQDASQLSTRSSNAWDVQLLDTVSSASLMQPPLSNERSTGNVDEPEVPLAVAQAPLNGQTLPLFTSSTEGSRLVEYRVADPFDGIASWLEPDLSLAGKIWYDLPPFEFGSIPVTEIESIINKLYLAWFNGK